MKRNKSLVTLSIASMAIVLVSTWVLLQKPLPPPPAPIIEDPACRKTYLEFYKDSTIDIRVIFGYKDARPARFVADRYERMNFVQIISKPCAPENPEKFVCGFERSSQDADLFQKTISGPDDQLKTILLRVTHSSVGPDDEENRNDPFQEWQTQYSKETFLNGLRSSEALFYNGHSRAGGGPDFEPARLRSNKHVAYDWYKQNQPGLQEMLNALNDGPSHLKLLGLFSCASSRLFSDKILQLKQELGLITSEKLLYFADAQENLLETFSALLGMKCQPEFKKAVETYSIQAGSKLMGFF